MSPAFNSSETKRVVSYWIKNDDLSCPAVVGIDVSTSAGVRRVELSLAAGTNTYASGVYSVFLNKNTDGWQRIERDIHRIVYEMTPGVTVTNAFGLRARGKVFAVDDVRFSNSVTVESNTFGLGVVGHILRNRQVDPSTYASTDRWFNYDQIGSVISEVNSVGDIAQLHQQDAFGNTQSGWSGGLWGGDKAGWHHNTKEMDRDTDVVYMRNRWYRPQVAGFISSAPLQVSKEHQYGFAVNNPLLFSDPSGRWYVRGGPSATISLGIAVNGSLNFGADSCGNYGFAPTVGIGVGSPMFDYGFDGAYGGFIPGTAPGAAAGNAAADLPQDFAGFGLWGSGGAALLGAVGGIGGVTSTGAVEGGVSVGAGLAPPYFPFYGMGGVSLSGFIPFGGPGPC